MLLLVVKEVSRRSRDVSGRAKIGGRLGFDHGVDAYMETVMRRMKDASREDERGVRNNGRR